MGDPAGIGPEVVAQGDRRARRRGARSSRSWSATPASGATPRSACGCALALRRRRRRARSRGSASGGAHIDARRALSATRSAAHRQRGGRACGEAAYAAILEAVRLVQAGMRRRAGHRADQQGAPGRGRP